VSGMECCRAGARRGTCFGGCKGVPYRQVAGLTGAQSTQDTKNDLWRTKSSDHAFHSLNRQGRNALGGILFYMRHIAKTNEDRRDV